MTTRNKLLLGLIGLTIFAFADQRLSHQVAAQDPFADEVVDDDPFGNVEGLPDKDTPEDPFADKRRNKNNKQPAANKIEKAIATESEIEALLDRLTKLDLIEVTLYDTTQILMEQNPQLNIVIDHAALDLAGIDASEELISLSVEGISLRSALRLMLRGLDLTYIIKNECLMVTTIEEAELQLEVKVYSVGDLIKKETSASVAQSAEMLIDVVTANLAPESWEEVGGTGAIRYYHGQLVASQTHEVHELIVDFLQKLRTSISKHGGSEIPLPYRSNALPQ